MLSRILPFALCLPMTAMADCPTAADLETGIRFDIQGGDHEVFRKLPSGIIEADYSDADGYFSRTLLAQGIYLVQIIDLDEGKPVVGSATNYALPVASEDAPLPTPGGNWNAKVLVNENWSFHTELQRYDFGQAAVVNFGACAYDMIPIDIRYDESEDRDVLHYLPQLELAYLAEFHGSDGSDIYPYSQISVVR